MVQSKGLITFLICLSITLLVVENDGAVIVPSELKGYAGVETVRSVTGSYLLPVAALTGLPTMTGHARPPRFLPEISDVSATYAVAAYVP